MHFTNRRTRSGSIMTWLLVLAIIGLTIVTGLIFLELLIRWVSLARVQTAAREASLVYARDMVRLRDNCLSLVNTKDLTFQGAGIPYNCNTTEGGACKCTPLVGQAASVPGALTMEYLNASQTLLYNVWGSRISDPREVDNVQQFQCYKPYAEQRFKKIDSPEPKCDVIGKVTSPITQLNWEFTAHPYNTGKCCGAGASNDPKKDFCVDVKVAGRMDPIMAGGLPFLSGKGIFADEVTQANKRSQFKPIEFITIGDFEIHARAVVNKMKSIEATGDDHMTGNLSGETIQLENIPANAVCAEPPPVVAPIVNPITPRSEEALSIPPIQPLPPGEVDPTPFNPPVENLPKVEPNCPPPLRTGEILNRTTGKIEYVCEPRATTTPPTPTPTPTPMDCKAFIAAIESKYSSGTLHRVDSSKANASNTVTSISQITRAAACNPQCGCYCVGGKGDCDEVFGFNSPLVLSMAGEAIQADAHSKFSFDGKRAVSTYWLKSTNHVGFLAIDLNGNGLIDDGTELFGNHTAGKGFDDGFKALMTLKDKNADFKLSEAELNGLLFWTDLNANGKSEKAELMSLEEIGVTEINLKSLDTNELKLGIGAFAKPLARQSVSIKLSGKTSKADLYDVWFRELPMKAKNK